MVQKRYTSSPLFGFKGFFATFLFLSGACGTVYFTYTLDRLRKREHRLYCRDNWPWMLDHYYSILKQGDCTKEIDADIWKKEGK